MMGKNKLLELDSIGNNYTWQEYVGYLENTESYYILNLDVYTCGKYKVIAQNIIADLIKNEKNMSINGSDYNSRSEILIERMNALMHLINRVCAALNSKKMFRNESENLFYHDYNWKSETVILPWYNDTACDDINITALNEAISEYLSCAWLDSPVIEWCIINGYLRYYINEYRKSYFYAPGSVARALACVLSKNQLTYNFIYIVGKLIGILLAYVLPAWLMYSSFIEGNLKSATFWMVLSLMFVPLSIISNAKKLTNRLKTRALLLKLTALKSYAAAKSWSPLYLLSQVKILNKMISTPELMAIVSKVVKHNGYIYTVKFDFDVS